jgi:orotidine-5'-phosphate decarboxylase
MSGVRPNGRSPLIAALDTADLSRLAELSRRLSPVVGRVKVGLEAYTAHGPAAVHTVQEAGGPEIFLDLKLHDIPNTVGRAAAVVDDLGVRMLTVHAGGGPRMIAAAVEAAPHVDVLAVTVLTSLDDTTLAALGLPPAAELVTRWARLAVDAGASGLVCATSDVARLRRAVGPGPLLVVPGIRGPGAPGESSDDQARTGTPEAAVAAGADWLVVGRPITRADDPVATARALDPRS